MEIIDFVENNLIEHNRCEIAQIWLISHDNWLILTDASEGGRNCYRKSNATLIEHINSEDSQPVRQSHIGEGGTEGEGSVTCKSTTSYNNQ